MEHLQERYEEYEQTLEELLQDVVLLQAVDLLEKQRDARISGVPPELLPRTRRRVLDYLSQHAGDLYVLNRELTRA